MQTNSKLVYSQFESEQRNQRLKIMKKRCEICKQEFIQYTSKHLNSKACEAYKSKNELLEKGYTKIKIKQNGYYGLSGVIGSSIRAFKQSNIEIIKGLWVDDNNGNRFECSYAPIWAINVYQYYLNSGLKWKQIVPFLLKGENDLSNQGIINSSKMKKL